MNKLKSFYLFSFVVLLISSCTIQKRLHQPGFHVEWTKLNKKGKKDVSLKEVNEVAENQEGKIPKTEEATAELKEEVKSEDIFSTQSEPRERKLESSEILTTTVDNENTLASTSDDMAHIAKQDHSRFYKSTYKEEFKAGASRVATELGPKTDSMAIAGFVLSLVGLLIFAIIFGFLAIVFSGIGMANISKSSVPVRGIGLAIAGLIIGMLDLVVGLLVLMTI